jgi:hypothetical protein
MHGRGVGRAARALGQTGSTAGKRTNNRTAEQESPQGASRARSVSPMLSALPGRRVSTVVCDTKINEAGEVTDPGHIQYQTSEAERSREPGLARAIGHSRRTDPHAPKVQRSKVSGCLPDGTPFRVNALKGAAIKAGDDKLIDRQSASRVIDHGEMTDEQLGRMKEVQQQPIFPEYETSGADSSNCVHGHAEVARTVFGWDVRPERHARPQDLAEQMAGFRTEESADKPSDEN